MTKRETSFTSPPPFVDPRVNPAAAKYAEELQRRQGKYNEPVGGPPAPPIPRLDREHETDRTMASQAPMGQGSTATRGDFFATMPNSSMHKTQGQGLLPSDLLPDSAKQDPAYQTGLGAMHATSQPHLAYKYGVIRSGQFIPAQQLTGPKTGPSEQSVRAARELQEHLSNQPPASPSPPRDVAPSGMASSAARLANAPGDNDINPITGQEKDKVKTAIQKMDDFDFNTFREMMMKDILNNEDQKKAIEGRLQPMDVTDMIMNGKVFQVVPIIPGKYEPEFQSVSTEEDLAIKRLIWTEAKSLGAPDQYMLDKYSVMAVTLSLRAISKKPFIDHLDKDGAFNEELFMKKFNQVLRLPFHMVSSLGINFFWFDVRVRQLFQADFIKNG